jgi:hypothetical protein
MVSENKEYVLSSMRIWYMIPFLHAERNMLPKQENPMQDSTPVAHKHPQGNELTPDVFFLRQ